MKTYSKLDPSKSIAVLIFALLLIACASGPPTSKELSQADYGSPISQSDTETRAKQFLRRHLKDPGSAVYEWNPVYSGWMREAPH